MKSFLCKLLIPLLLVTAPFSFAREQEKLGCWFDTFSDTRDEFAHLSATGYYCPVETSTNHFNIGKIAPYESYNIPECYHTDAAGNSEFSYNRVRFLHTSYEKLKTIIKSENTQSGVMHESIADFNNRFPSCTGKAGTQSLASEKPKAGQATGIAQVTTGSNQLCLKEEMDKQNGDRMIRIGYWTYHPGNGQDYCQITPDSPSYKKASDQSSSSQGTPDREFVCKGFEVIGSGWAGKVTLGIWDKDYNCNKKTTKGECCKFAQQTRHCKYLSWDPKGKCCCGPDLDKKDKGRGDENIALKRQ